MMTLEELPMTIKNWYRKSGESNVYLCKDRDGLAAIVDFYSNTINFGYYKPCGANIKKVKVSTIDEVVSTIEGFKYR